MLDLLIVTPTLNSDRFIEETILSVKGITGISYKHVIVDSFSRDRTLDICRRHGLDIYFCKPGNMYKAINYGLNTYKATLFTYINSDDLLNSNYVNECLKYFSFADVVYGNINYINEQSNTLFKKNAVDPFFLKHLFKYYNPVPQQGTIFKSEVFNKLSGFNTSYKYSSDYDFFARSYFSNFVYHKYKDNHVASFRLLSSQLSQRSKDQMKTDGVIIRTKLPKKKLVLCRKTFAFLVRNIYNIKNLYNQYKYSPLHYT